MLQNSFLNIEKFSQKIEFFKAIYQKQGWVSQENVIIHYILKTMRDRRKMIIFKIM